MRVETRGQHEHTVIFMGVDEDHLVNTGKLALHKDEWVLVYNAFDNGQANPDGCYNYEFLFERINGEGE